MNKRRAFVVVAAIIFLLVSGAFLLRDTLTRQLFKPTATNIDEGIRSTDKDVQDGTTVFAQDLAIPWEVAFLPGGDLLVTERPGTLKRIGKDQQTFEIKGVEHVGEGGLLGLALHPDFASNQWLYLYLTTETDAGLINRVERYRFTDDTLTDRVTIIDAIPGASFHDGGRIAFGPDGYLYVTTGDAGESDLAQNLDSLAGKTLRLHDDGSIPAENPFASAVYSYGHRNAQGMAWDDRGRLWQTEHGRSGRLSGFDELNVVDAGKNYGWPVIEGDDERSGMETPIVHSGANETWAPAGMAFYDGSLFFAGLRGESLYEAVITDNDSVSLKAHLRGEYGRLRAVTLGPDNHLYVTTSNTDGRGGARSSDDKIIRINPAVFRD